LLAWKRRKKTKKRWERYLVEFTARMKVASKAERVLGKLVGRMNQVSRWCRGCFRNAAGQQCVWQRAREILLTSRSKSWRKMIKVLW